MQRWDYGGGVGELKIELFFPYRGGGGEGVVRGFRNYMNLTSDYNS